MVIPPQRRGTSNNGAEFGIIAAATVGAIVTSLFAARYMSSPAAAVGIGILVGVVYWRLLRGFVGIYYGFRHRLGRLRKAAGQSVPDPDVYHGLRSRALSTSPGDLNLQLDATTATPYGVLMETGRANAIVTLTSFLTGDASLYFSTGGGLLGGIRHESVRNAAVRFVKASASFLNRMQPTTATPSPQSGMTRFFVLTTRGLYTAEALEDELGNSRADLSPLFHSGQDVITQLRLSTAK